MDYTAADLERIDDHAAKRLQHEDFLRNKPEYSDGSADLFHAILKRHAELPSVAAALARKHAEQQPQRFA